MTLNCNHTAKDWISRTDIETIPPDLFSDCWPWERLTPTEWVNINKQLLISSFMRLAPHISLLSICSVGIVGALLSALTVWHNAFVKKERFYLWMFAISLLDSVYNLICISYAIAAGKLFPSLKSYSYWNVNIICRLIGLMGGFTLASDLCTLFLTAERLWTLRNTGKKVNGELLTFLEILSIVAFASARCAVYAAQYGLVEFEKDKYVAIVDPKVIVTGWWKTIIYLTNTILPFLLLFLMICLSSGIGMIVYRRRKSPVFINASPTQQLEIQKQSSAIIRLCFALSVLILCNQFGCCLNLIAVQMFNSLEYGFNSSYDELVYYGKMRDFARFSQFLNIILECASKSLNFFFYYLFTWSFREEFKQSISRLVFGFARTF